MDQAQYSTLIDTLRHVPDPRHARGKQLEWSMILGVIVCALLCQQRSIAAIADWTQHHHALLLTAFRPARHRLPSEATIHRALRHVDVAALEQQLHALTQTPPLPPAQPGTTAHGHAVDGKYVRGAGAHGHPVLLVSLVNHASARVLGQVAMADKQHESRGVAQVLADRDLAGSVITLDAGLTHPALARQILAQGGQYFMVVKRNQARLYQKLTWYFDTPPLLCDRPWHTDTTVTKGHGRLEQRTDTTVTKGHGRLEQRTLTCTDDLDGYLSWPGVQQVLRRDCERTTLRTGEVTVTTTYALTSLAPHDASAATLAQLWREHWAIENRVHDVRDVTFGEDAHQMSSGTARPRHVAQRPAQSAAGSRLDEYCGGAAAL